METFSGKPYADPQFISAFSAALLDPCLFTRVNGSIRLRSYQRQVITSIADSVFKGLGLSFVVMFPRQSGKNELQAQLEAYLLTCLSSSGAEIIKISPTWRPQSLNAIHRLESVLKNGLITTFLWEKGNGYIYRINHARITFLSGEAKSHIVGATASTLLEVDEAQDVPAAKYDKEIAPMAASTNATRVFWGTAWTSHTLLARELRQAGRLEQQDGIRRVFRITADEVAAEVPPYGAFLREQVERLGRQHPMVRSQFYSEEIDEDAGMFPAARQQLMRGSHPALPAPQPGRIYAFLIDVGGEDPAEDLPTPPGPGRDATALTVVEVDLSTLADDALRAPTYRVVLRRSWRGQAQPELYQQIRSLIDCWKPRRVYVDATGIGAGLAAFLKKSFPARVRPFLFTSASKSNLGWDFLSVCDTGRFKDHAPAAGDGDQREFWRQVGACQLVGGEGPGRRIRWGVPDGTNDPAGEAIHDDLLVSAALCALLDQEKWSRPSLSGGFILARDPLDDIRLRF
jgi:hypothetical protein